jgi:hypothetical protein
MMITPMKMVLCAAVCGWMAKKKSGQLLKLTKKSLDNIPKVWYNKDTNKRGDNNNEHQPEEEEHRQQLQTYQEGNEEESLSEG